MNSTGDTLSALGYGCMRFPLKNGRIDEAAAERQILLAVEKGVNYFDTDWPTMGGRVNLFLAGFWKRTDCAVKSKLLPSCRPGYVSTGSRWMIF